MSEDTVNVKYGAEIEDLEAGTEAAAEAVEASAERMTESFEDAGGSIKDSLSDMQDGIKESFADISNSIKGFFTVFAGITAVLAGGAAFKEAVAASQEWTQDVVKLSKAMGVTTQEASTLNAALHLIGKTSDEFTAASFKLLMQIRSNEAEINNLGVKTRDASGHMLSMTEVMRNAIGVMMSYKEGGDRNSAAMYLFGRSAQEVLPLQKLNNELMEKAAVKVKEYGLEVGESGVEASKKYKEQTADLNLKLDSIKVTIGRALLPALNDLASWFIGYGHAAAQVYLTDMAAMGVAMENIPTPRDPSFLRKPMPEPPPKEEKAWQTPEGPAKGGGKGGGGGSASIVATWSEDLQRLKDMESQWANWSTQTELEFWEEKLQLTKRGSDDWWAVWHHIADLKRGMIADEKQAAKKQAADEEAIAEERMRSDQSHAEAEYTIKRDALSAAVELGQISAQEELEGLKRLNQAKYDEELTALYARLALKEQDPREQARIYADMRRLQDKYRIDTARVNNQMAVEQQRTWKQIWDSAAGASSNAIKSMIRGTMTWKQAVGSVLDNVMDSFIDLGVKVAAGWLKTELTKTAATVAGEESRVAAQAAGQSQGLMVSMMTGLKQIMNNAYQAASGAYNAVVSIPYVGPVLAPIAAAVSFAAVAAFGGGLVSSAGGYDIPAGVNPLVQAHARETVLPAELSDKFRAMSDPAALMQSISARIGESMARMAVSLAMPTMPQFALAGGSFQSRAESFSTARGSSVSNQSVHNQASTVQNTGVRGGITVNKPQFHFTGDLEKQIKRNPRALYRAIEKGVRDGHMKKGKR